MKQASLALLGIKCRQFQNKCSGLTEDMSKRIMYSILPSLADSSQVALTQGIVDYRALKSAVAGAKTIIEHGVKATITELMNARTVGLGREGPTYYDEAEFLAKSGRFEDAMDLAVEAFDNDKLWYTGYGGYAWAQIAKTLRQIIRLNKTLETIRRSSNKDHDQEIQVMRDLVVELNIFDGLAHNSENVMRNLVELEHKKKHPLKFNITPEGYKEVSQGYGPSYRKIRRLMDAKELESPAEVFRAIQPTLENSGDINQYKDWVSKMRRTDEFRNVDPHIYKKLFVIYVRKAIIQGRGRINQLRDKGIADILEKLHQQESPTKLIEVIDNFSTLITEIDVRSQELMEYPDTFMVQYPEYEDNIEIRSDLMSMIEPYALQISGIVIDLNKDKDRLPQSVFDVNANSFTTYLSILDKMKSLANKASYILDTI